MATPLKLLKNPSLFLKAALSPNLFSPKVPDCTKHAVSCKKQTPSRKVGKIQPKQLIFCKKHHNVDTPPKNYKTTSKTLWAGPKVVDNIENMNIIQSSDINGSRKEKSESNFLHIIGKGKFGTVVKGVYNGKLVAIKIKKITTKVSRLRASREFNGLGLNHENIVKTLDIIFDHDQALVVMEYNIKSKSLQSELDEQQSIIEIDLNDWDLKVAIDVSKGVCFLHDHGILHLDIKPANIIMCDNGVCKICDFGNSVQINRAAEEINCCGTVAYTDPEILKGNSPSEKSDIYSLGVLFWQIRNKERPYSNHCNGDIVIYKVVKYNLRPSTKIASTNCRSSAFSSIYKMCWSADPKLRPTAEQVLVLLRMVEKQGRIV